MNRRITTIFLCGLATGGLTLGGAGLLQDATDNAQPEAPAPNTHTLARGDLTLEFAQTGRLDSAERLRIRLVPEQYSGTMEIAEIVHSGGPVREGEVILRIDAEPLERQIANAERSLRDSRTNLEFALTEQQIQIESNRTRLDNAEKALARAEQEAHIWSEFEGPKMLKTAELSVRQREIGVENQREELEQLEMMYEGTRLASETKEIVLERSRRSLAMSQEWLQIALNDHLVATQFRHPDREQDVHDTLARRAQELEHLRATTRIAEVRKEMEIANQRRNLEEAEERLGKLHRDLDSFTVRAPADGILTRITQREGDTVNSRQLIAEIVDPSALVLRVDVKPEDLRILSEGATVRVGLPAFPEVSLRGTVEEIGEVAGGSGATSTFPVTIVLNETHPLARVGLQAEARDEKVLRDVLLIPKSAVKRERGRHVCDVWVGNQKTQREIVIGAGNDEFVQVIDGLATGEEIVVEEKKR